MTAYLSELTESDQEEALPIPHPPTVLSTCILVLIGVLALYRYLYIVEYRGSAISDTNFTNMKKEKLFVHVRPVDQSMSVLLLAAL